MEPLVRLFVAIPLPSHIRERLTQLRNQKMPVRWISEQNIHLTLKFIGEIELDRMEGIQSALRGIEVKSFLLGVREMGVFPERGKPKVLWVGLGGGHPHLFQLHKKVNDTLFPIGVEPDRRVYRPHITIGRCSGASHDAIKPVLRANADFETAPFRVESFQLFSSDLGDRGPIYQSLEKYPLVS